VQADSARSTTTTSLAGLGEYVGRGAPDGDAAREALRDAVRAAKAA
jgi:hypothetical protein